MLNTSTIQSNAVQYYLQTNLAEVVLDDDFPIPLLINKWIQCLYSWYILRIVCQCQLQCSSRGEEESISSKNIATIFPKCRGSRGYRESWFSWHSDTVIDVTRNRLFECSHPINTHAETCSTMPLKSRDRSEVAVSSQLTVKQWKRNLHTAEKNDIQRRRGAYEGSNRGRREEGEKITSSKRYVRDDLLSTINKPPDNVFILMYQVRAKKSKTTSLREKD